MPQHRFKPRLIIPPQPLDHRKIRRLKVAQFHIGHKDRIRPAGVETNVKPRERLQRRHRIALRLRPIPSGQQLFHMPAHQIKQQRLLVGRVIIERARLHPHRRCDLPHRDRRIAMPRKKPQRRLAHTRACNIGMRALGSCHDIGFN